MTVLERLAARQARTLEAIFRDIFNYGPKDPRFLDCDDVDILIEIYRKAHIIKARRKAADKEAGRTTVETDERAWGDIEKAVEQGMDPATLMASLQGGLSDEDYAKLEAEAEETERLMGTILGPGWQATEPPPEDAETDDDEEAEE